MVYVRKGFNISVDQNDISVYLREIQKYPILSHEEEIKLSTDWINNKTDSSAHKLINSHLRLVVKIAMNIVVRVCSLVNLSQREIWVLYNL